MAVFCSCTVPCKCKHQISDREQNEQNLAKRIAKSDKKDRKKITAKQLTKRMLLCIDDVDDCCAEIIIDVFPTMGLLSRAYDQIHSKFKGKMMLFELPQNSWIYMIQNRLYNGPEECLEVLFELSRIGNKPISIEQSITVYEFFH